MAASVPQAVQSCHELLLWLISQLDKFPARAAHQVLCASIYARSNALIRV